MRIQKIKYKESDLEIHGATLLSVEEAEELLTKDERKYHNWWWLRSPGYFQYYAAYVLPSGSVLRYGSYVRTDDVCIRPALKISNLESSNLKIGDLFEFGGKQFKIISDTLAFCLDDIGTGCFRDDGEAKNANIYKESDIKKYIDNWFSEVSIYRMTY